MAAKRKSSPETQNPNPKRNTGNKSSPRLGAESLTVFQQQFEIVRKRAPLRSLGQGEYEYSTLDRLLHQPHLVDTSDLAKQNVETEYLDFQNTTYAKNEVTQLWLLVWRSLKAMYHWIDIMPAMNIGTDGTPNDDEYMIERSFFGSKETTDEKSIQHRMRAIIDTGDLHNQEAIEDIVDEYCQYIADCHNNKTQYYQQFKLLIDARPVAGVAITHLQRLSLDSSWDPAYNVILHRVTVRLNYLLANRRPLRRWWICGKTGLQHFIDLDNLAGQPSDGNGQSVPSGSGSGTRQTGGRSATRNNTQPSGSSGRRLGGAAGSGGQNDGSSGNGRENDRDNDIPGRIDKSSVSSSESSSSESDADEENNGPSAPTVPMPTKAQADAFVRGPVSPTHSILPQPSHPDYAAAMERAISQIRVGNFRPAFMRDRDGQDTYTAGEIDDPTLERRVLPSANPYVQYPLGETRASERAMGMQVGREMRERGIRTSGPHVEDVQNIPPRSLRLADAPGLYARLTGPGNVPTTRGTLSSVGRLFARDNRPSAPVPDPLPQLTRRTDRRRRVNDILGPNRDGTAGVQRARDRASGSPTPRGRRTLRSPFSPLRSGRLNDAGFTPWQAAGQAHATSPTVESPLDNVPEVDAPNVEASESLQSVSTTGNSYRPQPGQRNHYQPIYFDENVIRFPVSPSRQGQNARLPDNNNITAASVEGPRAMGADTPAQPPNVGDGLLGHHDWRWIPENNPEGQNFRNHDQDLRNRGDPVRLRAAQAYNYLCDAGIGGASMIDLYEILRYQFEYGLTGNYHFGEAVPGRLQQNNWNRITPPAQIYGTWPGGAGTGEGFLGTRQAATQAQGRAEGPPTESDRVDRSPRYSPSESPTGRPRSWGSWAGGANGGNQDFQLYESPRTAANGPGSQQAAASLPPSGNRVLREQVRDQSAETTSVSSTRTTKNLPASKWLIGSPVQQVDPTSIQQNDRVRLTTPFTPRSGPTTNPGTPPSVGNTPTSTGNTPQPSPVRSASPTPPLRRTTRSQAARALQIAPAQTGPVATQTNTQVPTRAQYMAMTAQQMRDEINVRGGIAHPNARKAVYADMLMNYDAVGNFGNGAPVRRTRRG